MNVSINKMAANLTEVLLGGIYLKSSRSNWLQSNWRPLLILWFAFLLGAHWFGLTPVSLSQETINRVLDIIQLTIGAYVIGRTGEKLYFNYTEKNKEKNYNA